MFLREWFSNEEIIERIITDYLIPLPPEIRSKIKQNKTLVLGVGGGHDIFVSLVWYLWLSQEEQDNCILCNYSFTDDLWRYEPPERNNYIIQVTSSLQKTKRNKEYFPEHSLSCSLQKNVHAIRLIPNPWLYDVLNKFVEEKHITHLILVDGGIDSVLYGDETPRGSPLEDSQIIQACFCLAEKNSIPCSLMCSALFIEEVEPEPFLDRFAVSSGVSYPIERGPVFETYKKMVQQTPEEHASFIQESIIAAVEGHRGVFDNPRLAKKFSKEETTAPCLNDLSQNVWWFADLKKDYFSRSPFAQFLQTLFDEMMTRDKREAKKKNKEKEEEAITKDWMRWNHAMMNFLREREKKKKD